MSNNNLGNFQAIIPHYQAAFIQVLSTLKTRVSEGTGRYQSLSGLNLVGTSHEKFPKLMYWGRTVYRPCFETEKSLQRHRGKDYGEEKDSK